MNLESGLTSIAWTTLLLLGRKDEEKDSCCCEEEEDADLPSCQRCSAAAFGFRE